MHHEKIMENHVPYKTEILSSQKRLHVHFAIKGSTECTHLLIVQLVECISNFGM